MVEKPITVSQLNKYIGTILTHDPLLASLLVTGEVSGIKKHSSGHIYFTLKDANSKVNCFFASYQAHNSDFIPQDGMAVIIKGNISLYEQGGYYSLNVKEISQAGAGNLAQAFERLKDKLEKEGLFKEDHKKTIPFYVDKVGIISSETGAALQDVLSTIRKRNPGLTIRIFPSLVQGDRAAADLIRALGLVEEKFPDTDVIIIARGGGSLEDLWAFNDEGLARAIFDSRIPIISAIGHETDFTIADFVADLRAKTPTEAAIIAIKDKEELKSYLGELKRALNKEATDIISMKSLLVASHNFSQLHKLLSMKADSLSIYIDELYDRLWERAENLVKERQRALEIEMNSLNDLNPFTLLNRGYGIVSDKKGKTITSTKTLVPEDKINIRLRDGKILANVINTEEN